jgi:hypothetical protein
MQVINMKVDEVKGTGLLKRFCRKFSFGAPLGYDLLLR